MPLLHLLRFVPIPAVQGMFNANDYITKGAGRAVELAHSRTGESNLLAKVIEDCEKEGEGHIDDVGVRIEAINIIITSTDTTGATLTYLTQAVLQRPELQTALKVEAASLGVDYTENDLIIFASVECCHRRDSKFVWRSTGYPRVIPQGGAKLGGHYAPPGTTVSTPAYTFHCDPEIRTDPLTTTSSEALSPSAKTAFHPFGTGARSCVGLHLPRVELRYAVAFFFRELKGVKLTESTTPESMEFENFFLIAPKAHRFEIISNTAQT
ncbi:cytochrome P450 [Amniculicola lignicola CBS 123094]|uniref:Cytochrome P450 n=1 Tax=Amniculicola lignicola CBS 123094 TaxID=1392246 RepID=A0A6A5WH78_9PLEO|nr:cytochrome P450 [Amniculicola lignicola CBS 123094]